MAVRVGSYSPDIFHALPYAEDAFDEVARNPLSDEIIEDLRSVFIDHGVSHQYGLSILHRHFDLLPEEMIVEYRSVAAPWKKPRFLPTGEIRPRAWTLADDVVRPLEFSFIDSTTSDDIPDTPLDHEFLAALRNTLVKHNLESRYGLSMLPPDAHDETKPSLLEFTAGRANVTVPLTEDLTDNLVKAMLLFPCIDPLVDSEYHGPRMRHCVVCYRH